jgi:hypothetical protein
MAKDRYRHLRNSTYICNECGATFTYWLVHPDDWEASGFEWKAVCKPCFEKRVPHPRYMTFEELNRYTEENGYTFFPNIERGSQTFDNLKKKIMREFGSKGLKWINRPQEITELTYRRTWTCEYCHSTITTYGANKPPEICLTCGR